MDEVYILAVRGERLYLSRAVDQNGDILDKLVQKRKNKGAAVSFFKSLMKGQQLCQENCHRPATKLRGVEKSSHAFFNALLRS